MSSISAVHWQHILVVFLCYSCVQSTQRRAVATNQKIPFQPDKGVRKPPVKLCPVGQLPQKDRFNNTVCCLPTACDKDHYIEGCTRDGEPDVCKPCDESHRQPHSVSSLYMRDSKCFEYIPERHNNCAKSDHVLHSEIYKYSCPLYCKCDSSKCFYGDPCHCMDIDKCGVNEEMDPETNTCKPCPSFAYKTTVGCERCTINITRWRQWDPYGKQSQTILPTTITTSPQDESASPAKPDEKSTNHESNKESPTELVVKDKEGSDSNQKDPLLIVLLVLISLVIVAILVILSVKNKTSVHLMRGKISRWFKKCAHGNDDVSRFSDSGPVTPVTDAEQAGLLGSTSDRGPIDDREAGNQKSIPGSTTDGRELNSADDNGRVSGPTVSRQSSGRDEVLYTRLDQDEEAPAVRMEALKSLQNASVNPLMRQTSHVVEVEINTPSDSSAGTPSDTDDTETETQTTEGASQNCKHKPGRETILAVQCPPFVNNVNTELAGNQEESGIGLSLEPGSLQSQNNLNPRYDDCCRGEQATIESVGRVPAASPRTLSSLGSTQPPSIGQREVIGASSNFSGVNLQPLIIPSPPVVRSSSTDNGSTHSPLSPKICLPDGGGTRRRDLPCAAITPLPRAHDIQYNSGGHQSSTYLQNSNQTESVPSYVFQEYDNGPMDIANITDFSSNLSVHPMLSNSQNNSMSSIGRRSQNPPEGAEYNENFMSVDDRENTEPKEVAPDVLGLDETQCKYVDRDNTSPKVICDDNGINLDSADTKYGKDKSSDIIDCSSVDKKDIVAMTEDSSSVISGSREIIGGSGAGDTSAVMKDNGSDIDKVLEDQTWSKPESDTTLSETEVINNTNSSLPTNLAGEQRTVSEIINTTDTTNIEQNDGAEKALSEGKDSDHDNL